jgi:hypothetical protein
MDRYTPRERMVIMALQHANEPITLAALAARAQYKAGYPLRTLVRTLIRAGVVVQQNNPSTIAKDDDFLYTLTPKPPADGGDQR